MDVGPAHGGSRSPGVQAGKWSSSRGWEGGGLLYYITTAAAAAVAPIDYLLQAHWDYSFVGAEAWQTQLLLLLPQAQAKPRGHKEGSGGPADSSPFAPPPRPPTLVLIKQPIAAARRRGQRAVLRKQHVERCTAESVFKARLCKTGACVPLARVCVRARPSHVC